MKNNKFNKLFLLIFYILSFSFILYSSNLDKILNLIISEEYSKAEEMAYHELLNTTGNRERINYLLGYLNFKQENYSEAKRRFSLVKNIKQEEIRYFKGIIDAVMKDTGKASIKKSQRISDKNFVPYNAKIPIRVLLGETQDITNITTNNNMLVTVMNNNNQTERFWANENQPQKIHRLNEQVSLNRRTRGTIIEFTSTKDNYIIVNNLKYRGKIRIIAAENNYLVINELDIEDYLKGVLKNEMSPNWHIEALKAQAVAARTFAYHHILQNRNANFHIGRTWLAQVYSGANAETPSTNKAVDETRGIIITHNGAPILAYFHADSGGYTEDTRYVWGGELDYIRSRRDRYGSNSPRRNWEATISEKDLVRLFNRDGYNISNIRRITPIDKSPSGRYSALRINHSGGTFEINSNRFRIMTGSQFLIRSSLFTRIRKVRGDFIFSGRGAGHGVGIPQWSAKEIAENGRNYEYIIRYYYNNIDLQRL